MAIMAYADDVLFWRSDIPLSSRQILEPKLKLEINKAGSFTFSVYKNNPIYNSLHKMKTVIRVEDNGRILFRGRVLDVKRDLFQQRKVTCEGDLTFLLDTFVGPVERTETVTQFFTRVIAIHNSRVAVNEDWKKFTVGNVTVSEKDTRSTFDITSFTKCSDAIDSELIQVYGGILQTRYENGTAYIDYIEDPSVDESGFPINDKGVRYGVNLIDFEEEYPIQELFTAIVPVGANKLNIASVNDGKDYIENPEAVAKFGRIYRVESWDDITNATTLKTKGQKFLNDHGKIFNNDLTVKAVDLRCIDKSNEPIKMGDRVRVKIPHLNIDAVLFCLSIEYDFYNPENNSYKLGTFIPADKHKGSKSKGGSRSRGGSGSSRSSRGISSGVSGISTEVAEFKDQTKEDFSLVRQNISLQAAEVLELQVQGQNHETRITLNEQAITAEATNRQTGDNELAARVTITENGLSSKVNKGSIISEINQSAEEVLIQAQKINLSGYVTADELAATNAELTSFYSKSGNTVSLKAGYIRADTLSVMYTENGYRGASWQDVVKDGYVNIDNVHFLGDTRLNLAHYHAITATAGTGSDYGKIILTLGSPSNRVEDRTTNFNIADTQFYKDGVSAAKSAMGVSVDGAVVKAAESVTKQVLIKQVLDHSYAAHRYTFKAYTGVGDNVGADNYMIYGVYTTDDQAYQDGLADGGSAVTLSSSWTGSNTNSYNTFNVSASNGESASASVYLAQGSWSSGSKTVYMRSGSSSGTNRARITVDMPSNSDVSSSSWSISPKIATQTVTVTIGGRQYSHTFS